MVAAFRLSRGSQKEGLGKNEGEKPSLGPKIPLQITPKLFAMHAYEAAECRVTVLCCSPPSRPKVSAHLPDIPPSKSGRRFLAGKQPFQAPEDRIRNKTRLQENLLRTEGTRRGLSLHPGSQQKNKRLGNVVLFKTRLECP